MFIKPELQIQKMNNVGIKIKVSRAKQDVKLYFVKQGRKKLRCVDKAWTERNPVISRVCAFA